MYLRDLNRKLAQVYAYGGRFRLVEEVCDKIIGIDRAMHDMNDLARAHAEKAFWYAVGPQDKDKVHRQIQECLAYKGSADFKASLYLAKACIRLEDFHRARSIIREAQLGLPDALYIDLITEAYTLQHVGNNDAAIEQYAAFVRRWGTDDPLLNINEFALAYIDAGKPGECIALLDKLQHHYFEGWWPDYLTGRAAVYPESYLFLGLAYERNGETRKAARSYVSLLSLWKKADQELPLLRSARTRLARLK